MGNKFKKYVEDLGFSYKKEILLITIGNLVILIGILVAFLFTRELFISLSIALLFLIFNFFIYYRYSNQKRLLLESHEEEFITVISYFQIFVNNHFNVYQCFQMIIPYTSEWMNEKISQFLYEIDNDKSIKPFVTFASHFKASITHNVMLSIYQMIDEGESSNHMMQFTILFEQLSRSHHKNIIDKKEKSMSSLATFPLFGAGAITLLLTFGVISIMGDMINVI